MDPIHTRADIPPQIRYLYIYLRDHAYETKEGDAPTLDQMAKDMGKSRQTIVAWLGYLEIAGLLTRVRRGLGRTNIYYLFDSEEVS